MKRVFNIAKTLLVIRWKHRKDFAMLRRSIRLGEKMLSSKKVAWIEDNDFSKIIIFVLAKNLQTARVIFLLCRSGLGQDALTSLRVMFESLVDFKYMYADKRRVQNYIDFDYYARIKSARILNSMSYQKIDNKKLETQKQKLEDHWNTIKHRFVRKASGGNEVVCSRWSCKDLRAMATEVGLQESYDLLYVYVSAYVHSASGVVNDYVLGRDKNSVVIEVGTSETMIRENLPTAAAIFLDMLNIVNEEYKLGFDKDLTKLSEQWEKEKTQSQKA